MRDLAVRALEEERMDDPALPRETYAAVMRDLAAVNRLTMARRPTLGFLRRALADRRAFRLLDVGFGDGDMLRTIARWAARRGIAAELVGIDLNPSSAPAAKAHTPPDLSIDWRTGDYAGLAGTGFDLVISSLVAHHMTHDQLVAFLRFMETEARIGWFVNDLHRHRFAHLGFPLFARIMRWHPIVRYDGTLSIARSYRPAEWPPILAEAEIDDGTARVFRAFPYRLCVERLR
jgi:2-polyprenyl-3-methyl-5-hydroxy-6-metoxy-1,4-benzoquinol methylase